MPILATGYSENRDNVFCRMSYIYEVICSSEYPEDKANVFCRMSYR
jgi:hypothetical protein